MIAKNKKRITITLDEKTIKLLNKLSINLNISKTEIIKKAMKLYLEKGKQKND